MKNILLCYMYRKEGTNGDGHAFCKIKSMTEDCIMDILKDIAYDINASAKSMIIKSLTVLDD